MMTTLRKRTETERGHSYDYQDMQPVEWKNGVPVRYEVIERESRQLPRVIGADDAPIVAPVQPDRVPRVQQIIEGTPEGEARAFNIRVSSLAAVIGGGVVLLALVFGASLSFWTGAMWFGSVYALVWALAFLWDTARSPGGVELVNVLSLWAFLRAEQRFRHSRYAEPRSERERLLLTVLGAAAVGAGVLFVLAVLASVAWENMPR